MVKDRRLSPSSRPRRRMCWLPCLLSYGRARLMMSGPASPLSHAYKCTHAHTRDPLARAMLLGHVPLPVGLCTTSPPIIINDTCIARSIVPHKSTSGKHAHRASSTPLLSCPCPCPGSSSTNNILYHYEFPPGIVGRGARLRGSQAQRDLHRGGSRVP